MDQGALCLARLFLAPPGSAMVKILPANTGDTRGESSIPGLGRSHGGGHGNPLQYSWLGNPWREEPGGLQPMGSQRVGND